MTEDRNNENDTQESAPKDTRSPLEIEKEKRTRPATLPNEGIKETDLPADDETGETDINEEEVVDIEGETEPVSTDESAEQDSEQK